MSYEPQYSQQQRQTTGSQLLGKVFRPLLVRSFSERLDAARPPKALSRVFWVGSLLKRFLFFFFWGGGGGIFCDGHCGLKNEFNMFDARLILFVLEVFQSCWLWWTWSPCSLPLKELQRFSTGACLMSKVLSKWMGHVLWTRINTKKVSEGVSCSYTKSPQFQAKTFLLRNIWAEEFPSCQAQTPRTPRPGRLKWMTLMCCFQ